MADRMSQTDRWVFWQGVIDDWQRSGLSVRAYCRQEGLSEQSFYQWRRRLTKSERKLPVPSAAQFAPVRIQQQAEALPTGNQHPNSVEIAFPDGHVVRVPEGVDSETLATVISALETPRC